MRHQLVGSLDLKFSDRISTLSYETLRVRILKCAEFSNIDMGGPNGMNHMSWQTNHIHHVASLEAL